MSVELLVNQLTPDKFWPMYLQTTREQQHAIKQAQAAKEALAEKTKLCEQLEAQKTATEQENVQLHARLQAAESSLRRVQAENEIHCAKIIAQEDTLARLSRLQLQSSQALDRSTQEKAKKPTSKINISQMQISECVQMLRDINLRMRQLGYDMPQMMAKEMLKTMELHHPFVAMESLDKRVTLLETKLNQELDFLQELGEEEPSDQ